MRLSCFIQGRLEDILAEWEAFARTLGPAADSMPDLDLRDHAKGMLEAVAKDLETAQTAVKQQEKSKGQEPKQEHAESAATAHGTLRHNSRFSVVQLNAEFRALRATVLRLWLPHVVQMSAESSDQIIRFNEAVDQAQAESLEAFSTRAGNTRDLFLAILGHDLRAPLSSMMTASALLAHQGLTLDQVPDIATRVRRSAGLMSNMVVDLIEYTRTQLGNGMPATLRDLDLSGTCVEAIRDVTSILPGFHCAFESSGDLRGSFDNVRMHQLFTNLLTNAGQHGERGRPVTLEARGGVHAIEVRVVNHGPVIPEDSLQAIFAPLVQLPTTEDKDAGPKTSLGLGLFIAREIALAHGGEICVSSDKVDGTAFTVRFPRSPSPTSDRSEM